MSPTDLHSALVAKVTEYLNIAEAAERGPWAIRRVPPYTDPLLLRGEEDVIGTVNVEHEEQAHIAAHDPSWAIRSHRQALETLNRHHPELQREWVPPQYAPNPPGPAIETRPAHMWEHWVCDGCDIWTNMGEAQREYENCPEVAGVRAVYLPEE